MFEISSGNNNNKKNSFAVHVEIQYFRLQIFNYNNIDFLERMCAIPILLNVY